MLPGALVGVTGKAEKSMTCSPTFSVAPNFLFITPQWIKWSKKFRGGKIMKVIDDEKRDR